MTACQKATSFFEKRSKKKFEKLDYLSNSISFALPFEKMK